MTFLEAFLKDDARQSKLREALSILYEINSFGIFMELGAQQNMPRSSQIDVNNYALRAAWSDGYMFALNDLFYFFDRYAQGKTKPAKINFGATDKLFDCGDITKEERERLANGN